MQTNAREGPELVVANHHHGRGRPDSGGCEFLNVCVSVCVCLSREIILSFGRLTAARAASANQNDNWLTKLYSKRSLPRPPSRQQQQQPK